MKIKQIVGEATGDPVGTVSTAPDASGKIKIKTATGTEIETNKDALLPGAKPGTVQMKPDAADDALKPGTQVVSAEAMGDEEDDGDPPIDSAESYKAWLQQSAAKSGLSPEDSAGLMNMLVTEPDGSIDMDATMVNTMKEFANIMPQLYEMFVEWLGILEKHKADPALWSSYTPEEQKSIDDAIADGKAQLPAMQAQIKQMQAQMPELDQAMANRKAAGNNMKIPATAPAAQPAAPMEELGRIKELAGLKGEDISFNGVTQHDNGDMSYNQGPLSMRQNKDGSSDMSATIGDTTARVQQNPIGVKTLTAQGPAADSINSVDASAERKGVDPKKFAAFQKQNPAAVKESPELTAMLSIAGLR